MHPILDQLRNLSAGTKVLGGVLFVLVAIWLFRGSGKVSVIDPAKIQVWYYDSGTGELFGASLTEIPPITAPSGKPGYKALVFSCGSCDESERFIGFLETYPPEVRAKLVEFDAAISADPEKSDELIPEIDMLLDQRMVSKADPIDWVRASSGKGFGIEQSIRDRCENNPKFCPGP